MGDVRICLGDCHVCVLVRGFPTLIHKRPNLGSGQGWGLRGSGLIRAGRGGGGRVILNIRVLVKAPWVARASRIELKV